MHDGDGGTGLGAGATDCLAIVLAGGRSERLGGTPKAQLLLAGRALLDVTLDALGHIPAVVVGPGCAPRENVWLTREDPPFGGPVRGLAAGAAKLAALFPAAPPATPVLILACDMPGITRAIPLLCATIRSHPRADGVIGLDPGGQPQPLAAAVRLGPLGRALDGAALPAEGKTPSLRRLLMSLNVVQVPLPPGASSDIDTWAEAQAAGVQAPASPGQAPASTHQGASP